MATKFDTVLDALETAFGALVTDETLKAVRRELLIPATEHDLPVLGLTLVRWRRAMPIWIGDCLLMIVAEAGDVTADQAALELCAKVDNTWYAAQGSLGGSTDSPQWEPWYDITTQGRTVQTIGARGLLRIRVEDPILVS